jgi:hypothetical protein
MYTRIYKEGSTFQVLQQKFWMRFLSSQLQATCPFQTLISSPTQHLAQRKRQLFFNPPYTDIRAG